MNLIFNVGNVATLSQARVATNFEQIDTSFIAHSVFVGIQKGSKRDA